MGRTKLVETPEQFLELWDAYKKSVDDDPDKIETVSNKGEIIELSVKRPYLRSGFESFVFRTKGFNIHQYIDNDGAMYDDYLGVVTCARKEWETDQVSGTLTGRYKSQNLVARLNGYTDKKEMDLKGGLNIPQVPDIGNRK